MCRQNALFVACAEEDLGGRSPLEKFSLQFTAKGTKQCTVSFWQKKMIVVPDNGPTELRIAVFRVLVDNAGGLAMSHSADSGWVCGPGLTSFSSAASLTCLRENVCRRKRHLGG